MCGCFFISENGYGQQSTLSIPSSVADKLIYTHELPDSTVCDNTRLSVAYRHLFKTHPAQNDPWEDLIILQIGNHTIKQFSGWSYQIDSALTVRNKFGLQGNWMGADEAQRKFDHIKQTLPFIPLGQLWFNTTCDGKKYSSQHTEIVRAINSKHLTIYQPAPFSDKNGRGFVYSDPVEQTWKIEHSEGKDICGYVCYKATTEFRGRCYTAWYTPGIPISAGPYKFYGLPGLILAISDDEGFFSWECISLNIRKRPVFICKYKFQKTTRNKYRTWERALHSDPGQFFISEGINVGIYDIRQKKRLTPAEYNWTIPYNPIELK